MNAKYKGWSEQRRWQEYNRLKRDFYDKNKWVDQSVYDAFIKRIAADLGI